MRHIVWFSVIEIFIIWSKIEFSDNIPTVTVYGQSYSKYQCGSTLFYLLYY